MCLSVGVGGDRDGIIVVVKMIQVSLNDYIWAKLREDNLNV
jgi:hypothetical protein